MIEAGGPFDRLQVSVDVVLFTLAPTTRGGQPALQVLVERRERPPFAGAWALPGQMLAPGESLEDAADRAIRHLTTAQGIYLEQLYTFGEPDRDPRGRVITIAYYALVRPGQVRLPAPSAGLAATVGWFPADARPDLAFDHAHILAYARWRLRNKIEYTDIVFQVLPDRFSLTHLRQVYAAVLGEQLDKRNFNRKILSSGLLAETGEVQGGQAHRPARLYAFVRRQVGGPAGSPSAEVGVTPAMEPTDIDLIPNEAAPSAEEFDDEHAAS